MENTHMVAKKKEVKKITVKPKAVAIIGKVKKVTEKKKK